MSTAITTTSDSLETESDIQERPVSFGNPALGVYHGMVSTTTTSSRHDARTNRGSLADIVANGAQVISKHVVAMTDVPPAQVPEGILNLARPYRPWICHVRIVIGEGASVGSAASTRRDSSTTMDDTLQSIQRSDTTGDRNYLVLIELCDEQNAEYFVQDLHGKPYTSLDETETCSIYHVVAWKGTDGVSLMSPFFAPKASSTKITTTTTTTSAAVVAASGIVGSVQQKQPLSVATGVAASIVAQEGDKKSILQQHTSTTEIVATVTAPSQHHSHEDYNCAVCLEHMEIRETTKDNQKQRSNSDDHDGSTERPAALLTTVCNHSFHMDCLLQWQDSPCPVCRYDHSGLNETLSQCHICGKTENNYVCLICGTVSCGESSSVVNNASLNDENLSCQATRQNNTTGLGMRTCAHRDTDNTSHNPSNSHAKLHYDETLHAYALDTESQHVWDFAGQGYVHRLLQNKDDGKLVEVSDPNNTSSQERSLNPGLSDAQEGEVVHRKLEGFAGQYYTLLKSQLEQQRIFYEGRLEEIRREYGQVKPTRKADDLIAALKQERKQLSQRLSTLTERRDKVKEDVAFLKNMNESIEANKAPLQKQIVKAQQSRIESYRYFEEALPPLQEKVTRLMLQLESATSSQTPSTASKPARR